ncbi:unnamed protein product [Vitrella brassicaformis CCMP3155]|uniref:RING-type domain-containing protein n=1 Tax=Vitrella brassicaformis (strain CCMP3155) TaxID=1169540 RepID=A0A0G4G773_VITBC|nr:unnamed protein product [Vitrella brassicaformis CCMP3155]|eukprot:CEM24477.1 unnamed protein product [Vitrella brassicaformis CCMP3155]
MPASRGRLRRLQEVNQSVITILLMATLSAGERRGSHEVVEERRLQNDSTPKPPPPPPFSPPPFTPRPPSLPPFVHEKLPDYVNATQLPGDSLGVEFVTIPFHTDESLWTAWQGDIGTWQRFMLKVSSIPELTSKWVLVEMYYVIDPSSDVSLFPPASLQPPVVASSALATSTFHDPLLVLKSGGPPAFLEPGQSSLSSEKTTVNKREINARSDNVDLHAYVLWKPYHYVTLTPNDLASADSLHTWHVAIFDFARLDRSNKLNYFLRVRYFDEAPCPRQCLGRGNCRGGRCQCARGYGDEDCSSEVGVLQNGKDVSGQIDPGVVHYYYIDAKPGENRMLIIDFQNQGGDPYLVIKGSQTNNYKLPTRLDHNFDTYNLNKERQRHQKLQFLISGYTFDRWFIAVNNRWPVEYDPETRYVLTVSVQDNPADQTQLIYIYIALTMGVVFLLMWLLFCVYKVVRMGRTSPTSALTSALQAVRFAVGAGGVGDGSPRNVRRVLDIDTRFPAQTFGNAKKHVKGLEMQRTSSSILSTSGVVFPIADERAVTLPAIATPMMVGKGQKFPNSPYMPPTHSVTTPAPTPLALARDTEMETVSGGPVPVATGVALGLIRGDSDEIASHRKQSEADSRPPGAEMDGHGVRDNVSPPGTLQEEPVEAKEGEGEGEGEGGATSRAKTEPPVDDFCCSVCLVEFEEDDEVRVLDCKHVFHKLCIDEWFKAHTVCPLCRAEYGELVPMELPGDQPPPPPVPFLRTPSGSPQNQDDHGPQQPEQEGDTANAGATPEATAMNGGPPAVETPAPPSPDLLTSTILPVDMINGDVDGSPSSGVDVEARIVPITVEEEEQTAVVVVSPDDGVGRGEGEGEGDRGGHAQRGERE